MNKSASDFYSQHFEVAGFIREVFGYMDRFKGQLFILKIDDSLMDHPLFPVLMQQHPHNTPSHGAVQLFSKLSPPASFP